MYLSLWRRKCAKKWNVMNFVSCWIFAKKAASIRYCHLQLRFRQRFRELLALTSCWRLFPTDTFILRLFVFAFFVKWNGSINNQRSISYWCKWWWAAMVSLLGNSVSMPMNWMGIETFNLDLKSETQMFSQNTAGLSECVLTRIFDVNMSLTNLYQYCSGKDFNEKIDWTYVLCSFSYGLFGKGILKFLWRHSCVLNVLPSMLEHVRVHTPLFSKFSRKDDLVCSKRIFKHIKRTLNSGFPISKY